MTNSVKTHVQGQNISVNHRLLEESTRRYFLTLIGFCHEFFFFLIWHWTLLEHELSPFISFSFFKKITWVEYPMPRLGNLQCSKIQVLLRRDTMSQVWKWQIVPILNLFMSNAQTYIVEDCLKIWVHHAMKPYIMMSPSILSLPSWSDLEEVKTETISYH